MTDPHNPDIEDVVELSFLTPNALLFGQPNTLPEMDSREKENDDLGMRARYLLKCKEALWPTWSREKRKITSWLGIVETPMKAGMVLYMLCA